MIFQDFPGPGIFKKKIQDFPGGVRTRYIFIMLGLRETHSNINMPDTIQKIHTDNLFDLGFVEVISVHYEITRGVFLANHLASTDNLTN